MYKSVYGWILSQNIRINKIMKALNLWLKALARAQVCHTLSVDGSFILEDNSLRKIWRKFIRHFAMYFPFFSGSLNHLKISVLFE